MGKIETWEVTGRTDESITFRFKRRAYKEEKLGENNSKSKKDEDGFDEETRAVLRKLENLNMRIRKKYYFDSKNPNKIQLEKEEDKEDRKNSSKHSEDIESVQNDSEESTTEECADDHVIVNGVLVKKGTGSEPCDHRGVPLSHPMAMTPYPGASTAAQREKARKMLKEIAKQMYENDLKTKKSSTKISAKSTKRSIKEKSKSKTSKSSKKKIGCDKCGSCQKCIHRCSQYHPTGQKVTSEEREMFLKGINRLRKRIVKPERSREKAIKSPYDVTQSDSETDLSMSKSNKGSKKKSSEN